MACQIVPEVPLLLDVEAYRSMLEQDGAVLEVQTRESGRYRLAMTAFADPESLSLMAALWTSWHLSLVTGKICWVSSESTRTSRILAVLEATDGRTLSWEPMQSAWQTWMARPEQAEEEAVNRVSDALQERGESGGAFGPVHMVFDNDPEQGWTKLEVAAAESPGFFYGLAKALALLRIDVRQVQWRTEGREVHYCLWVQDEMGLPITSPAKQARIRQTTGAIRRFVHLLPLCANPHQALHQFREMVRRLMQEPVLDTTIEDLRSTEMREILEQGLGIESEAWDTFLREMTLRGILRDTGEQPELEALCHPEVIGPLAEVLGCSRDLWEGFLRVQHDNLFPLLSDSRRLDEGLRREDLEAALQDEIDSAWNPEEKAACLNAFKDREIFRCDIRHLTGRTDLERFTCEVTAVAEVTVAQAAALCHEQLQVRYGQPELENGSPCAWSALALGKCGGREMGFASDIELIFVYEGAGQTNGPEGLSNQEYFIAWVCQFLKVLSSPQYGIFEIDLRLRPHGKDGMVASSLEAFADYYHPSGQARPFERQALIKLRPVAGDPDLGRRCVQVRDDFVYSGRDVDYEDLLHLRHRQATELVTADHFNTKYSQGGLVDLEYWVQARQMMLGRHRVGLRESHTRSALDELEALGEVTPDWAEHWREAYDLMRRLIDGLRMVRGHAKDLDLPASDSREFYYLARRLGYGDSLDLAGAIERARHWTCRIWG